MREEFMITRQGKPYVLYAGLLDAFHDKEKEFDDARPVIETDLVQIPVPDGDPTGEGMAIVTAKVGFKIEDRWIYGPFGGIGDASPQNVNRNIAPHLIRMAETRAKARALRDCLNIQAEVLEDMAEHPPQSEGNGSREVEPSPDEVEGVQKGGAKNAKKPDPNKARKSQIDLLTTLATEWRGEEGPERLEKRIGKPLRELSRKEADEWIDRLTPEGRE